MTVGDPFWWSPPGHGPACIPMNSLNGRA